MPIIDDHTYVYWRALVHDGLTAARRPSPPTLILDDAILSGQSLMHDLVTSLLDEERESLEPDVASKFYIVSIETQSVDTLTKQSVDWHEDTISSLPPMPIVYDPSLFPEPEPDESGEGQLNEPVLDDYLPDTPAPRTTTNQNVGN